MINTRDYGYIIAIKNNEGDIRVKYEITNVRQDISLLQIIQISSQV